MTPSQVVAQPMDIVTIIRNEKRHFEELLWKLETGQLTHQQFNTEIKNAERALRILRYSRSAA